MLASRALVNNNVVAEVAHDGFDRSNLDLQLALGERILMSLLKLYRSPLLMVHPEGVRVLRGDQGGAGGGNGGGEGKGKGTGRDEGEDGSSELKIQEHARAGPASLQTQLGELFRNQADDQQGSSSGHGGEEKGKKSGNKDDDRKRQEGHLGTVRTVLSSSTSSSSSSSARTHGGRSGRVAASRTRGSHRSSGERCSSGTVAQQQQSAPQEQELESSSPTRARTRTTSGSSSSSARAAGQRQNSQGHGDDGGNEGKCQPSGEPGSAGQDEKENDESEEGEEGEEGREGGRRGPQRVTTPLALLDHPECEDTLQALCEELRERFLSMREVMEPLYRDPRSDCSG